MNRQVEQWNERQASKQAEREEVAPCDCLDSLEFAAGIEPPISRIDVQWFPSEEYDPVECEDLLGKLEKYQDNGMFKEHDELVTEKIRYYEERGAFTMVWILKIEECTTYSYKGNWEEARKKLASVTLSNISVEYSDVIKARAMYLLVAHMRRNKEYRTLKPMLLYLIYCLEVCEQLLHNYNSPEDWAEFYQTFGCVRMDYMSQLPLDTLERNVELEKAIDCFRKAIYFSQKDPRQRVQMKRQSYAHLQLAKLHLIRNDYHMHDIEQAERHLDIVQFKFGDTLPTATRMLLYKTQSVLLWQKGQHHPAIVKAMKAFKLAVNGGFATELNTLQEQKDCYQKKLDQMLSGEFVVIRARLFRNWVNANLGILS